MIDFNNHTEIKVVNPFNRVQNKSLDSRELLYLCLLIDHYKPVTIMDIGTFEGNTALNMLANTHDHAKLWTVDIGDLEPKVAVAGTRYDNKTKQSAVGSQIKGHPLSSRISMINIDSMDLDWDELPWFDFILIDGCHKYEVVKHDTEMALKHLNEGGVILWHDYGYIPDVTRMIDELTIPIHKIERTRFAFYEGRLE